MSLDGVEVNGALPPKALMTLAKAKETLTLSIWVPFYSTLPLPLNLLVAKKGPGVIFFDDFFTAPRQDEGHLVGVAWFTHKPRPTILADYDGAFLYHLLDHEDSLIGGVNRAAVPSPGVQGNVDLLDPLAHHCQKAGLKVQSLPQGSLNSSEKGAKFLSNFLVSSGIA